MATVSGATGISSNYPSYALPEGGGKKGGAGTTESKTSGVFDRSITSNPLESPKGAIKAQVIDPEDSEQGSLFGFLFEEYFAIKDENFDMGPPEEIKIKENKPEKEEETKVTTTRSRSGAEGVKDLTETKEKESTQNEAEELPASDRDSGKLPSFTQTIADKAEKKIIEEKVEKKADEAKKDERKEIEKTQIEQAQKRAEEKSALNLAPKMPL